MLFETRFTEEQHVLAADIISAIIADKNGKFLPSDHKASVFVIYVSQSYMGGGFKSQPKWTSLLKISLLLQSVFSGSQMEQYSCRTHEVSVISCVTVLHLSLDLYVILQGWRI